MQSAAFNWVKVVSALVCVMLSIGIIVWAVLVLMGFRNVAKWLPEAATFTRDSVVSQNKDGFEFVTFNGPDYFGFYRLNKTTGEVLSAGWDEKADVYKWKPSAKEPDVLPAGDYHLMAFGDKEDWWLFRVECKTGEAWAIDGDDWKKMQATTSLPKEQVIR